MTICYNKTHIYKDLPNSHGVAETNPIHWLLIDLSPSLFPLTHIEQGPLLGNYGSVLYLILTVFFRILY